MRAIQLILLVPLVLVAVFGPETSAGTEFRVKGVLISQSSSSVMVNNTVLREGEQLDGIEILAIREGEVEIRRGSERLTVPVGNRAHWDLATPYTPAPAPPAEPARPVQSLAAATYGPVQRGDTLSEIAEQHLVGDITRHQMIVALYDANPEAFDGNINRLREGAVLRIPDLDLVDQQPPATATAEVLRQVAAWREQLEQWLQPTVAAAPDVYGPVTRGETLSGIAASLARDGTTMNQMMVALYETNPQAFGGNINLMVEGAVLQVPDEAALRRHSHASATVTIMNHFAAWRQRSVQLPDGVLVSMQGLR